MLAEIILEKLYNDTKISKTDIIWICQTSKRILLEQPILLELQLPVTICGDTHGQFLDTCRLFERCGDPSKINYLFLGDYVDRGCDGVENMCLLLLYKIIYPENFFLLRGNHECGYITKQFGFYDECVKKYDEGVWSLFCDVFNCLPVAAIISDRVFCVHGGISPELKDFDDILAIKRPAEVPAKGLLCDLLWSDPDPKANTWGKNNRGTGVVFGLKQYLDFKRKFGIDIMVRGHQVIEDGYNFPFGEKNGLLTIFSAPNYCGLENDGKALRIKKNLVCTFQTIEHLELEGKNYEQCKEVDDNEEEDEIGEDS
ncbi:Serine/threonine protein phosphatase alpha-1 isoform [Tritrichomonas foetus]|uniref:Serine/threonine-protein phosphatase n=1 Tax=Tritrichomonas foetus TaxID=1144522 RepID=A0A1J4IZJ9_9EUKA|nr:Serine/threonine protein phosphatase alpha-1 isoform [Tritrichomonas foetus]|eukprot:OHS92838.1 Serine/threonine protein phosphatase alpha-1 isoform [Tritrichomonas foetus]